MIPEVDISSSNAAEQLRHACIEYGFFYLINHNIPQDLVTEVYTEMKSFFHEPLEEKLKVLANEYMRGYTGMQEETLDPSVQKAGDTKEGYYIGRHVTDPEEMAVFPLHGPNVFPNVEKYPSFQLVMEKYYTQMCALGYQVAQVVADAAGAPGAFQVPGYFDKPLATLRLLHYDAIPSNVLNGIFGCGAHSDYGLLTLLSTDENPGLEIWYKNEWIQVPPRKDAFIVNIGDMAERWTNGLFKSTRHRVCITSSKERYSVPFFYEPNYNAIVECFPSCVGDGVKYPTITSGDHLLAKYRQTHASFTQ